MQFGERAIPLSLPNSNFYPVKFKGSRLCNCSQVYYYREQGEQGDYSIYSRVDALKPSAWKNLLFGVLRYAKGVCFALHLIRLGVKEEGGRRRWRRILFKRRDDGGSSKDPVLRSG